MRRLGLGVLLGGAPVLVAARSDTDLVQQLDREVIALRQRVAALAVVAENCGTGTTPDPVYPELVQAFAGTGVPVRHRGDRTDIHLGVDLLFPVDSFEVREEARFALDFLSTALAAHPRHLLLLTGHTDQGLPPLVFRPAHPTAWEVSLTYARALGEELMRSYGLSPERVTLAGRGDQEPVDSNDTPEGRAQNRRVVLTLSPGTPP